jgi:hypothetical protein
MPRPQRQDINAVFPAEGPLGKDAAAYAREIHAPAQRPHDYRQIIARDIDDIWSIDIATMHGWRDEWYGKQSQNDNMKYMLLIVDTFSRFLWAFPLKGKSSQEVKVAFESIKERHPRAVMGDQGREFMGDFLKYAKSKGIRIYHIYGDHKAAIAERCIRTVQELLWRLMTARQTRRWVDLLPLVVEFYNDAPHSSLGGLTPNQASDPANMQQLWLFQYGHVKPNKPLNPKFQVGDTVRVSIYRDKFDKGYHGNWSLDAYEVADVSLGDPVMYTLKNLDGSPLIGRFYESQLQKTAFPRIEIEKEVVVKPKPKDYTAIERIIDAATTWNGREWKYEGVPMVWLKCKFEGLSDAANEALPRAKLWLPYVSFDFDDEGLPNPAIEAFLKKKKLWGTAQAYRKGWLEAKRQKKKKGGGFDFLSLLTLL